MASRSRSGRGALAWRQSAACGRSGSRRVAKVAISATAGRKAAATTRLNAVWKLIAMRPGSLSIIASHDAIGATKNRAGSATAVRITRLPSGTRRLAGGEADSVTNGASEPPTLAPRTSASASGTGNACAAASDITSSTIERLEWTSHEIATAAMKPSTGSPARPVSSDRNSGESRSGAAALPMCTSASSIRPRPMKMRATPRARSASVDMNTSTPIATSTVQSHFTSKENTCATIAEPTSAPRMTASASGSAIRPRPANEASSIVVAVELCRMPVTPIPARNAPIRVRA